MVQKFKRWYDHDEKLLEVINILKDYQSELKEQAELFLESIEKKVSKEAIEKYYQMVKPINGGVRWYDNDPTISRTIELLRVVPKEVQRKLAQNFIDKLKENGINVN